MAPARDARIEDLVDQEDVGEQRPQVDERVQVVDHLRADGRLGAHQADGSQGCIGIAPEHVDERPACSLRRCVPLGDGGREQIGQHDKRLLQPLEVAAHLPGRARLLVTWYALGGVGEKELVAFLDRVDASLELAGGGHPSVESRTTQRWGS